MDKSPIEEALHLAQEFKFDQKTMKELELLALPEVKVLTPEQIKDTRKKACLSQNLMAHCLNVCASTYQKWERGDIVPSGGNMKLLNIVYRKGISSLMR